MLYPVRMIGSGIAYDMPASFLADQMWSAGRNFVMRDGIPEKCGGAGEFLPAFDNNIIYLLPIQADQYNWWIAAGTETIEVGDRADKFDISPTLSACSYNDWTGCVLGGIPILNNYLNDPVFWNRDTGTPMQVLPGWVSGTKCKSMRAFKYHLIAMNIAEAGGDFGDAIYWSSAAEPGAVPSSWTPTASNEAGSNQLAATGGVIVDGLALGDQFIVYKNSSTYAMQYVGGNEVFAFRKVLDTSGLLCRNAVVEHENMHIVLTDSDVIMFDGNNAKTLLDGINRRWLFGQMDTENYTNSYLVKNYKENEVWICFPTQGNQTPNMALIYCIDSGNWGVRELPLRPPHIASGSAVNTIASITYNDVVGSYDESTDIYNHNNFDASVPVMAQCRFGSEQTYITDSVLSVNGQSITGYLQRLDLTLGHPERKKQVNRVWAHVEGSSGAVVTIRVGARDNPSDPIKWGYENPFRVGVDKKVDAYSNGKYISLEIKSTRQDQVRVCGYDIDFTLTGLF